MKPHIFLTIALSLFVFTYSNTQQNQVTGPKAKNRNLWKNSKPPTIIMFKKHSHEPYTGPKAKNHIWEDDCEAYPIVLLKRRSLQGPKAKNTRPGSKDYWVTKLK